MDHKRPVLMTAALLLALSGGIAAVASSTGARAATTSLMVGRLPRAGGRQEHRLGDAERLVPSLDVPRQPGD
jgi:hypothetical protein